ncbi:MAG: hypothetical protein HY514_04710 [Candidatus Aenigmarchaeota archaeon]|nr:hypothetical protein [Candidatus Aenigmarchaeota archaeon]
MRNIAYFILTLLFVVFIGLIGYYFGFLGFIYNIALPNVLSQYNLIILSVIFGIAAFFSPCAFTVLPSYVSYYASQNRKKERRNKSLYLGLMAAAGIVTVNMILGIIIGILGNVAPFVPDPRQDIPAILVVRIVSGFLIAALGIVYLTGRTFHFPFLQGVQKKSFSKSMYAYGVVYNGAAIGCTGPILLGLMLYALSFGSFTAAITAFLVFSLTMGILMVTITLLTDSLRKRLVTKIAENYKLIKMVAAVVMIISGFSIALLTLEGNRIFVSIFFPHLG